MLFRLGFGQHETRAHIQKLIPSMHKVWQMYEANVLYLSWLTPVFVIPVLKMLLIMGIMIQNFGFFTLSFVLKKNVDKRRQEKVSKFGLLKQAPTRKLDRSF